jgi:hypothetical protein
MIIDRPTVVAAPASRDARIVHMPPAGEPQAPYPGPTVTEALVTFEALCLKCLLTQTGYKLEDVLFELEVFRADLADLSCAICAEDWPVFTTPTALAQLRNARVQ